jgi:multiple sugar transport system substrate-binding protein
MKIGKSLKVAALVAALGLTLTACGDDSGTDPTTTAAATTSAADEKIELTMSGWSLATTPEFQTLIDEFKKVEPNITITLKEYDPNDYEKLMLADMTGKTAPDIITIKQAKYTYQWATGGQLLDISDIVGALPSNVTGAASYTVEGKNYGVPYRQDSWLLFYNVDLFEKAGVAIPDGTWTWEDYAKAAKDLTAGLDGVKGAYQHSWQSSIQGLANAQGGSDIFSADYSYMKPYYDIVLDLQDSGAQETYGNVTTNKLTYQASFGKQSAAMMLMGSWYIATLTTQMASGDADTFKWGMAPVPQKDASTVANPVTFGDPTGIGVNPNIDAAKIEAAKKFVAFTATEQAAIALAKIGITPSVSSDAVTAAVFSGANMPTDDLSKKAYQVHTTKPENPSGEFTMQIQTILGTAHTNIMSETTSVEAALEEAATAVKNQDW